LLKTTPTTHKYMTTTHPENISPYKISYLRIGNSLSYMCFLPSRNGMILRAPKHTPTSLQITPTKETNPDTATPSLLQQPVHPTIVSHI